MYQIHLICLRFPTYHFKQDSFSKSITFTTLTQSIKTVTPSKTIIYPSNISLWNLLHALIITRGAKIFKRGICIYIWSEKLVQSLLELKSLSVSQLERSGWDNITAPAREGFNFWGKTQINSLNDDEVHTSYLSFCTQPQFDAKKINA